MRHSLFFFNSKVEKRQFGRKRYERRKTCSRNCCYSEERLQRMGSSWGRCLLACIPSTILFQISYSLLRDCAPDQLPKSHFVNRGMVNWSPKRGGHCGEVWLLELCTCCLKTLWNLLWKNLAIVAYNFKESHTFITVIIKDRKVNAWKICLLCKTVANSKRCCPTIISNNVQMYPFRVW